MKVITAVCENVHEKINRYALDLSEETKTVIMGILLAVAFFCALASVTAIDRSCDLIASIAWITGAIACGIPGKFIADRSDPEYGIYDEDCKEEKEEQ